MRNMRDPMTINPSLLLVDDERGILTIVERFLQRRGFRVSACANVVAALEAAERETFDVAVLDRTLKGDDGLQLAQTLQCIQPQLRIIMLSGHADPQSRAEAGEVGVFEYLTKPCGLSDLENSVRKACEAVAEAYKGEVTISALA